MLHKLAIDVWETCAEIPYFWRVTTQIFVVLLTGHRKLTLTIQKHYPDLDSGTSSVDVISRDFKKWFGSNYGRLSWLVKKNVVFLFTLKVGQVLQILSLILRCAAANIWPLHSGTLFKNLVKDTDMKLFSHKNIYLHRFVLSTGCGPKAMESFWRKDNGDGHALHHPRPRITGHLQYA